MIEIEIDNYFQFDPKDAGLGDDASEEEVIEHLKTISFMDLMGQWNFRDGTKVYANGEVVAEG